MKRFSYYSKFDLLKESIDTTKAINKLAASVKFASRKQLYLREFLKLYSVVEWNEKNKS